MPGRRVVGAADPQVAGVGIALELSPWLMLHWSPRVEGWLFRPLWFVPSKRGDLRLGVACRTDLLLSPGAGLILHGARQWDGAGGEGRPYTHTALVRVGAGLPGAGDSGPSHTQPQTSVPGTMVLQGWAAPSAAGTGPGFPVFGAGSTEKGPGEPCWAPLWSRFCLVEAEVCPKGDLETALQG